jgi:hypothetical protein
MNKVSTDYSGRKTDLFILQGARAEGEQQLYLGFGDAGEEITGIEKLVQSFLTLFLARTGTVPSRPEVGSDFVTAMQQGRILDDGQVISEFAAAAEQVKSLLLSEAEANNLSDDETVSRIVLQSFDLDRTNSKLTLTVRVESVAGTSRVVYLPVPLAIR